MRAPCAFDVPAQRMLVGTRTEDVRKDADPPRSTLAVAAAARRRGAARRRTENLHQPETGKPLQGGDAWRGGLLVVRGHAAALEGLAQFKGKSVFDRFVVGSDIDAISRASISIKSGTRAVRDSVRVAVRTFLSSEQVQRPAR